MQENERTVVIGDPSQLALPSTRRRFLKALGMGGTLVLLPSILAACDDDDDPTGNNGNQAVQLDLSTDIGILNYAFALEQLEAAFYERVVGASTFSSAFTSAAEREVLTDVRNDEVVHREFYRAALGSARIPDLTPNFSQVNFADRASVLNTARTFEDLGVAAYNGAGKYLRNANNLTVAGKIVSVEARHAAAIRDILDTSGTSFADLNSLTTFGAVPNNGLDGALEPNSVLTLADPFIDTSVGIRTAPTR